MLCTLVNHSHVNEIQTVTQAFFPHARFTFSYDKNAPFDHDGYAVSSLLSDGKCTGEVFRNGVRLASHTLSTNPVLTEKRALILALFHALKKVVDAYTPWGALTGIRPSKLARQWLSEGRTEAWVIKTLTETMQCHEDKVRLAIETAHAEERLTERIYQNAAGKPPLGLYISIPFCPSRCLYCSFNTCHKPVPEKTHALYIDALLTECRRKTAEAESLNGLFTAIYIGGGTPTVLSASLLEKLLNGLADCFSHFYDASNLEFTVEAGRPDSLTREKLQIMKDHGVNRIAVNPQTLNDRTLSLIGRSHTTEDFFRAFALARTVGFACINADIIAGLPGEGLKDIEQTMSGLVSLQPENITVHTLAVKRASKLNEKRAVQFSEMRTEQIDEQQMEGRHRFSGYTLPTVPETEAMLMAAYEACTINGLNPYYLYRQKNMVGLFENVGYSRAGFECLYNVGMMAETQTVLGAGAGAVSKYVDGTRIDRAFNVKNPDIYIQRILEGAVS